MLETVIRAAIAAVAALLVAAAATGLVRRYALRSKLLDVPNARSSHSRPTPRGGGIGIVAAVFAGLVGGRVAGWLTTHELLLPLPAAMVAVVGLVDDRRGLPPSIRLAVHFVAAIAFLVIAGGAIELGIPAIDRWPWFAGALIACGLVWLLNLYNFMDGIDGIAGAEMVFAASAIAIVGLQAGVPTGLVPSAALLAGSAAGFLLWNWPPARIFMGDVGSGFCGFALGVLSCQLMADARVTLWVPLIIVGVFITDATMTLGRRALRGESVHQAHRTHAYQWLSRRFGSHRTVVVGMTLINVAWLLPMALLAQRYPGVAPLIAVTAYLPLVALCVAAGSGRPERESN